MKSSGGRSSGPAASRAGGEATSASPAGPSAAPASEAPEALPADALDRARRLGHQVTPGRVRRQFQRWKPLATAPVPEEYERVEKKARQVDKAVDSAYEKVAGQLRDGKLEQLDGVSDRRFTHWAVIAQDPTARNNLKSAATGYIIEDHATEPFRADPMVRLQATNLLKNTRPDVVIEDEKAKVVGYLDITSSRDAGHIFKKEGHWGSQPYVAESLYPSLDFSDLLKGPVEIDPETMKRIGQQQLENARRKWKQVQKAYESRKQKFEMEQFELLVDLNEMPKKRRLALYEKSHPKSGKAKVERTGSSQRYEPYPTVRRDDAALLQKMEKAAITLDANGDPAGRPFDQVLEEEGVAFSWEHVQELFGLGDTEGAEDETKEEKD